MSQNVINSQCKMGAQISGSGSVNVGGGVHVGDTFNNVKVSGGVHVGDTSNKVNIENNQGIIVQHNTFNQDSRGTGNGNNRIDFEDFHVPKKNESFFGRDTELKVLKDWFTSGEQKMIVVCGCAGYGKTELVKQFVRQSRDGGTVAHFLWMDAETSDKLLQSFRDLARVLQLPQVDDASLVQSVFLRIESAADRSVMVMDNAENRKSVREFEPEGKTMCVVTSRMQDWDDVPTLPLTPLLAAGALALLLDKLPGADEQELSVLAAALSHVPLALHVAASYVRQEMRALKFDFNLTNYVRQIQDSCDSLIDTPLPSSNANTYDKTLSQAIHISLDKIQNSTLPNSEIAWKVLHISAYLYSDKITVDVLLCILALNIDSKSDILRACTLLQDYSLVTFDQFIKIHRFIQNTLVTFQNQNNLETFYMTCLQLLFVRNQTSSFHRHFILNHVGKNSDIFTKFYITNKIEILNDRISVENLISAGCYIGLEIILNDLGGLAADVINKLYLLHKAVHFRQHDMLKLLLARGAYVDQKNDANNTALHDAANKINLCAVQILTSHNADVNATNAVGRSVLQLLIITTIRDKFIDKLEEACVVLRWLVECGARTDILGPGGVTLLHFAAKAHCAALVRCLVCEFHLDVNAKKEDNMTPLYWVSYEVGVDRARVLRTAACLLELGARRDVVDKWGETPAQVAHRRGLEFLANYLDNSPEGLPQQDSFVDILIAAIGAGDAASLTSKLDELGKRAVQVIDESSLLHEAVRQGQHDVVELLLARGAYVDIRDDYNKTALHQAVDSIDLCAVKILTSHNADVNATVGFGRSVLQRLVLASGSAQHISRSEEVCTVLRWLVEHGARTDVVGSRGRTLLHWAAWAHNADLVRCLVCEFHLDVHAVDEYSMTPLHWVSESVDVDRDRTLRTAECLLELGARRDVVNCNGLTPANYARALGHEWFATWLYNGQDEIAAAAADI